MFKRKTKKRPGMRWWFPLSSSCKIMVISFRAGPAICPPYPSAKTGLNLPSTYFYPNKFQNMEKNFFLTSSNQTRGFTLLQSNQTRVFKCAGIVSCQRPHSCIYLIWGRISSRVKFASGSKKWEWGGVERKNRWTCWEWGFVDRGGKTLRKLTEAILVLCTHMCSH